MTGALERVHDCRLALWCAAPEGMQETLVEAARRAQSE